MPADLSGKFCSRGLMESLLHFVLFYLLNSISIFFFYSRIDFNSRSLPLPPSARSPASRFCYQNRTFDGPSI